MDIIRVEGGHALAGAVHVSGAKNSALKLMAATLLAPGVTTLTNVPNISDVAVMGKVLKRMGATIEVVDQHSLSRSTPLRSIHGRRRTSRTPDAREHRGHGPAAGRFGCAKIAMPGGCNLGARKSICISSALRLSVSNSTRITDTFTLRLRRPSGTTVTLEFASVGATENLISASVRAEGTTVIDNAGHKPDRWDLANMLNEMGARITGAGTPVVQIEGVDELHPVTHRVIGDRIEAGTFIVAGALAAGPEGIEVTGRCPSRYGPQEVRAYGYRRRAHR